MPVVAHIIFFGGVDVGTWGMGVVCTLWKVLLTPGHRLLGDSAHPREEGGPSSGCPGSARRLTAGVGEEWIGSGFFCVASAARSVPGALMSPTVLRGDREMKSVRLITMVAKPVETSPPPEPPESLGVSGRRLWESVVALRRLPAHELVLLELAGVALDRAQMARADIDKNGLTVSGRFGDKSNPAIAVERNSQLIASRLIRQLGLPTWWSINGSR